MEEKDQDQKKEPSEETTNIPGEEETSGQDSAMKAEQAEQQLAHYKDLFLRKAAEFDNFKRRMESETSAVIRFANEDLLLAILPVVDDLERSLKTAKERQENAFYKGVELIYQKMLKALEAQGVKAFETVGKEFDVHFHDALLQVPKADIPPHTILEEVEKGYMFHDKVLRHAKVVVSTGADPGQEVDAETESREKPSEN